TNKDTAGCPRARKTQGRGQEGIEKPNELIENNGFPRLGELIFPPLVPPLKGFDPVFSWMNQLSVRKKRF
ncbi:MAG: hypothetical protein Q4A97_06605, partial [Comamonadaceae bacterium]|nr:hypothetical protein [Comamonadaceae bacterium]